MSKPSTATAVTHAAAWSLQSLREVAVLEIWSAEVLTQNMLPLKEVQKYQ
jgi:hypothetical protein